MAVGLIIDKFEELFLEPQLRSEYAENLRKIKKQRGIRFRSTKELKERIKNVLI